MIGILAAIGLLIGVRKSGRDAERLKNLEEGLEQVERRDDVEDKVKSLSDDDVDRILRDNDWFRK